MKTTKDSLTLEELIKEAKYFHGKLLVDLNCHNGSVKAKIIGFQPEKKVMIEYEHE